MKAEICIVGGGPSGLAAALALTQSGRDVIVIDCAIPPIDKACGEGLMPDSLEALAKLGVSLPDAGFPLHGIRFIGSTAQVTSEFPDGLGKGMRRVLLHQQLILRAEQVGVRVMWGVKNVQTEPGRVSFRGGHIHTKLIVGADGQKSTVRGQAGLNDVAYEKKRYGFRRHYEIAPWSPFVEVYWGHHFQIYITPVAHDQVCVALISINPHLRLAEALEQMPALSGRLQHAPAVTPEMGSMSISRKFRRLFSEGYVLLGDASGSVDAITGEGMCLAFKQSAALVEALDAEDIPSYQRAHRKLSAKPLQMAALMLLLDSHQMVQRKAIAGLAAHPELFRTLLAVHVGQERLTEVLSWQLLSFGLGVLCA